MEQLNECDIYVVDIPGVETLLQKLKNNTRPICIIYFDASIYNRIHRMIDRHDSDAMIISRLLQDEKEDWLKQLDSLVRSCHRDGNKYVQLYKANANNDLVNVVELVLYYIKIYTED